MRVLHHFGDDRLDTVQARFPQVQFVRVPASGALDATVHGEVLLVTPRGSPNMAELLGRGVKWVHITSTGVDGFPFELIGQQVVTCSRGASALAISEWCLAMLLAFEKDLPDTWLSAPPEQWYMTDLGALHAKTLGLVGLGGIGTEVARRALAFGMRVIAVRRTGAPSPLEDVEVVGSLPELLAQADHVVLAAPATAATRHLLDAEALAGVKPGVHIVNVARGDLVDQEALRAALDSGRVARASLDTVTPEPLPEGHWLYEHPRVRLSAHVSWCMPGAWDLLMEPFEQNLGLWLRDRPLQGVVDLSEQY